MISVLDRLKPSSSTSLSQAYNKLVRLRGLFLGLMVVALVISFFIDLSLGPSSLSLNEMLGYWLGHTELTRTQVVILDTVRLPYSLMAIAVGVALGLAGAEMQTALNNPLASPFTLGISAAASMGAALAILFELNFFNFPPMYSVPISAFICAIACAVLLQFLARIFGAEAGTLVLFGIALSFAFSAVVAFLHYLSDSDTLAQIVFWSMGSLGRASTDKALLVFAVFAVCLPFSMRQVWALTLLRCGEDHAKGLGISVERLRIKVMLRVSLLTAVAISFVGEIGFIGLVAPHMARMLIGEDHRFFLPASALAGGLLMSLASMASKSLLTGIILPVSLVTSLVGIPLFMALIITRNRRA